MRSQATKKLLRLYLSNIPPLRNASYSTPTILNLNNISDRYKVEQGTIDSGGETNSDDSHNFKEDSEVDKWYPKPEPGPRKDLKTPWGFRRFLIFLLCHAVPIGLGVCIFESLTDETKKELQMSEMDTPEKIVNEALTLIQSSAVCLCAIVDSGK
eukprot:Filipodium_phascolosomae@DN2470_c0_g1_i10.p1